MLILQNIKLPLYYLKSIGLLIFLKTRVLCCNIKVKLTLLYLKCKFQVKQKFLYFEVVNAVCPTYPPLGWFTRLGGYFAKTTRLLPAFLSK